MLLSLKMGGDPDTRSKVADLEDMTLNDVSHIRRADTVGFHLDEIPTVFRFTETGNNGEAGARVRRNGELTSSGDRAPSGTMRKF